MNPTLLRIYHSLPKSLRSVAATGRGAYLSYWRYDRRTEKLVEEAFEREHWTAAQWKKWQQERLALVLHRAATQVPYYREIWNKKRRSRSRASWQYLENWDILEKKSLREDPKAFVADDCKTSRMFAEHTSGTTAKPVTLWRTREVQRQWYALHEARTRYWYGVTRRDRWGIFGGQLIVPVTDRTPPFWLWNSALNQLYLSSYHLAPDLIPHYLDALKKYRVKYLLGYSSALYSLAQQALRLGRQDLRFSVAITNAEPLTEMQRQVISEAFKCPVRETYGSAEIVGAASECGHGKMHLWPEVGYLESLEKIGSVENAIPNEMICTGLMNADMPLIRYRMGDCAKLETPAAGKECECGRSLPQVTSIEGRSDDVLYTPDGRAVGRLDPAFKGTMPIHEAQIIQETLHRIRILYVPAEGFSSSSADSIVAAIKEHMGPVEVVLEKVKQVPREKNGKFRAVISKISPAQRTRIAKVAIPNSRGEMTIH
jgi:phenylacetate-CoA ligase